MDEVEGFNELPEVALRMDEALEGLGEDAGAMMLSELNGYLCGVILSPEAIPEQEWMREIWDANDEDDAGPFANDEDRQAFAARVRDYRDSLVAELDGVEFEPIFDIDGESEEIIWEIWILGFSRAVDLRPDAWNAYLESDQEETTEAMMNLMGLIAVADPDAETDEPITDDDMAEIQEAAPDIIPYAVSALYHAGDRGNHPAKLDS